MRILAFTFFISILLIGCQRKKMTALENTVENTVEKPTEKLVDEKINWVSWEEAVELNKKEHKKMFVDVYTDWCGWCKRMDKSTFSDPEIAKYLNENFYAIKFNAEQKEDIVWNGNTFKFVKSGRRGAHELASALLNGRLGYPSMVLLDEEFARIMISPGFKKPEQLEKELVFAKEEKYKEMNWEDYKIQN